jgi:hypothetical protein
MKASELRIGNYVYDTLGKVNRIDLEAITYIVKEPRNQVKPIPLTEEWLLKLGAKKDKIDNTYYLSELEIMLPNFFRYKTSMISRIDYVHQLQNLYFALIGEELTLKSE